MASEVDRLSTQLARLESDLEHFSKALDKLNQAVIDAGPQSLTTRVVLIEQNLKSLERMVENSIADLDDEIKSGRVKSDEHIEGLRRGLENIRAGLDKTARETTELVEFKGAIKQADNENVKGRWVFLAAVGTGLISAFATMATIWLKSKFGG